MRILVAGGGSGGHVTPVLAILEELATQDSQLQVRFICDRKFAPQARKILAGSNVPVTLKVVAAGKLRRYHGVPLWKQLVDLPTVLLNIRDVFLLGIGTLQSLWQMATFRPAAVFTKGGFVCLPVGFAAHLLRRPLVIHDSDAHPGLTNRILSRWATKIATGAPLENYQYDRKRTTYVGIPVAARFHPPTSEERQQLKQKIMHDSSRSLLVVTGGGLGAERINVAMLGVASTLLQNNIEVIHVTGAANGDRVLGSLERMVAKDDRQFYHVRPFVDSTEMAEILKAADAVISRSGATAMAELAALGKAIILIPSPYLTGGHQLKNADAFRKAQAAEVIDETTLANNPQLLVERLLALFSYAPEREVLEKNILKMAKPNAARDVADLIMQVTKGEGSK